MPGATLDSVDGDDIKGRIKVKVGPIAMTYAGTARFTERDEQAHVIVAGGVGQGDQGRGHRVGHRALDPAGARATRPTWSCTRR